MNLSASRSGERRSLLSAAGLVTAAAALLALAASPRAEERRQDYPTDAIADYVFACMATNGETHEALEKCSCSIDVVASILPYKAYVEAETVARMRQVAGEKGSLFRSGAEPQEAIARLKRAQAEAEIRCF